MSEATTSKIITTLWNSLDSHGHALSDESVKRRLSEQFTAAEIAGGADRTAEVLKCIRTVGDWQARVDKEYRRLGIRGIKGSTKEDLRRAIAMRVIKRELAE